MDTPIRTGIIDFGLSGRVFHAPFVATNPDFQLALIATSDPRRRSLTSSRYPNAEVVASPDDLLARAADLDLVVLASPAHTHLEQGLAALKAWAAVVVDKPFAPSVAEALIAAAAAVQRPLIVFHNRRWDGDFLTVKKLIASSALCDVTRFKSTFERWAGPRRDRWQDTTTPAQGAGIAFDIGSYLIGQSLQLFGPVAQLHAELRIQRAGGVSDDDAFVSFLHDSGVRSHLAMSSVAALSGPRFRMLGSSGRLLRERARPAGGGAGLRHAAHRRQLRDQRTGCLRRAERRNEPLGRAPRARRLPGLLRRRRLRHPR